jgi:hypothetical protein
MICMTCGEHICRETVDRRFATCDKCGQAEIEKDRKKGRDDERERIVRDVEKWIENNPSGALWMLIDIIFKRESQKPEPLERLTSHWDADVDKVQMTTTDISRINFLVDAVNELRRKDAK